MGLRFAPLIRVSTEGQASKGESLRTQTTQIKQYVKSLGGTVPECCWKYSGQEHATPDQERAKLEQLLSDSGKGKFDAVIVCDTSRWSRDNQKSKQGLEILRNNNIKFFVGTMEYDLFNPEHSFILGMSAEVGELQARQQALKSITNRIERAKRGIPSSGNLPYGRTFDRKTETWGIDPEKHKNIKWAAERYLAGESIVHLAKILDMNFTNLWKILNHRSGTEWEIRFRNKKVNIDETVTMQIPPLLDEATIQAIKEQGQANKTYEHGVIKHKYLLSRMIFCQECGYTLMGQANHGGRLYYRHPKHRKHDCIFKKWIPAKKIEDAVIATLFHTFGDVDRIEKAIKRAVPNLEEVNGLQEEHTELEQKKSEVTRERDNLINLAAKGILDEREVESKIKGIRTRLQAIDTRLEQVGDILSSRPDPDKIKRKSRLAKAVIADVARSRTALERLDYERKKKLVQHAFSGKDAEGNRLGVYVRQTDDPEHPFTFEVRGILETIISGNLPKDLPDLTELLDEDTKGSFVCHLPEQVLP